MKLRDYLIGDMMQCRMREPVTYCAISPETVFSKHPAWTLESDKEIIACGGAIVFWPGVAQVWLIVSPVAQNHRIAFVRAVRIKFRELVKVHGINRLQAIVNADFAEGKTFVKMFGFRCEGYMHGYLPDGGDAMLFAWVGE